MNESASKSSLASSSGKPSTANSSGSPNGRKTRTIIVARTIPDESAKVVPAASRGEGHSNGVSAVVNQQHSRDVRSGKLASYAALGGAEDVDRFDKFLADQRGLPSASELRAAATSPQHMHASTKRKTMSRIQLDVNDGKPSETDATEDTTTQKLMQRELENDTRKRREEAVAHRKWLNSLPIHERVAQQRQQNVLRKWRQTNRDWEGFKERAARRLGKAPQELVMSRAAAYREQREMYDALQKARPLSDKVGADVWLVSLRNEGTRFVPVGNIFSGLFCPIRENTKLGPRVRRPLDYLDNQQEREHEASRPLSKLEKRSLNLLARKKWRLRKQLEVIQPHEVDRSVSSHLAVGTVDLFAWASGALEETSVEDDSGSIQTYSANVDEASYRHRLRSYASPSSPKSIAKRESANHFMGPSLRIAHVVESDEEPSSTSEVADVLSGNNPEACLPPLRLNFYTPVDEQDQRSLSVTNDGSTIVHYQWWRAPFEDENGELTAHLRGHRTRREEQELESCKTISVSKLGGTLLPGEVQQFVFTFESSKAGVFLEKWLLDAEPQPRICFGTTPNDTDNTDSSVDLPVEVRLSCVAEDNFAAWRRRQMHLTSVEQSESHFFVANMVDEILDGVGPPEAVSFSELTPRTDATKFYEQNGSNEFCDAYFSPDLVRACYALYERAQDILRSLSPVLAPAIEEASPREDKVDSEDTDGVGNTVDAPPVVPSGLGSNNEGLDAEAQQDAAKPPALPAHLVEEWNWRLETLRELCKMADEAQNAQIGRLTRQLKREIEDVEEEDENEEEDEEDDAEDDEADDDDEGSEHGEVVSEKIQRLSPREVRTIERLARRTTLEGEISALKPDLQETFDMMRYSAYTAPYSTLRLHERLHERIGSLCSEAPVICEIAKMTNANNAFVAQIAKVEGVGKLLMRAIDEAVGGDQDHQALFEQERRRIQDMWLGDKASYLSTGQCMAKQLASTSPLTSTESTDIPATSSSPASVNSSGVVLVQLDLDLAPWFSLVKVENKGTAASVDGVPPRIELAWRFSPDLIQHASFVPSKVTRAAESLTKILDTLTSTNAIVHTVVLVSELSRPPLTRKMCKLLRSAAQAEIKATSSRTQEAEEGMAHGNDNNGEAEEAMMKSLLERLSSQLSLRGVAQVVQRAMRKDIVFCSSIEEAEGQVEFSRKDLLLNSSISQGRIESASKESKTETVGQQGGGLAPRILLLEHVDAAGKDLIAASRKRELAPSKPATPAPSEPQKPAAGAVKKPSVVAPTKGKPGTHVTSAAPVPVPPVETPSSSALDLTNLDFAGKDLGQQGAMALCSQFSRMASACILDGIPSQVFESAFAFDTLGVKHVDVHSPPPTFAGPRFYEEIETWSQTLQPTPPCNTSRSRPCVVTAVVGGKCLESKLRLIDGLLEFVHEIYFVGEVAMSLYRVLHAKQTGKPTMRNHNDKKYDEEDEELEDGAVTKDGSEKVEGDELSKEGVVEEDAYEPGNENDTREHLGLDSARPKGVWDLLVPVVENLQRKASRKCVRLMLPVDWIVGDTPLDEQDLSAAAIVEEDDDDEEEEEEEEAGEAEEEDRGKKSRKRRASELKSARQQPLIEPDDADMLALERQGMYEGGRAHVVLNHGPSRRLMSSNAGWQEFQDVTSKCLSNAHVAEGKASVLTSLTSESEADDADEEGDDGAAHNIAPAMFEHEWTFRAMDIGPIAMETLQTRLVRQEASCIGLEGQPQGVDALTQSRALIVNGVCGAVEFLEFCSGTKRLLAIIRDYNRSEVFIAGDSTASWLRQIELEQLNSTPNGPEKSAEKIDLSDNTNVAGGHPVLARPRKVVDDRAMRNARVLKQLLAAKPHPVLANLASSSSK
ncbi:hypothetical protein KRP22_007228 [Phytophthora ramorum]|nr:MYCBP-associated protein [Phytophthora ramorum]